MSMKHITYYPPPSIHPPTNTFNLSPITFLLPFLSQAPLFPSPYIPLPIILTHFPRPIPSSRSVSPSPFLSSPSFLLPPFPSSLHPPPTITILLPTTSYLPPLPPSLLSLPVQLTYYLPSLSFSHYPSIHFYLD